ncbi:hypothetical protein BDD12DRAFT_821522 [Trichophaea hybrida]|nr:hypothetical protein BDD12DRAFT_821522 [Trichophaea hybrida]
MRFSPLLLLAQAAALSTAFLVPPEITDDQLKALQLPIDIGQGLALSKVSTSRIVRIPCAECSYKEKDVTTDLVLDFNLPENDHTTLKLNGATILPLEDMAIVPLKATQMPHGVDTIVYFVDKTQFPVVEIDNARLITTDFIKADGSKQYTFELNVIAVDSKPVSVQGVQMIIKEAPDGVLSFGHVNPLAKGALKECGMNIMCMFEKMLAKFRNTKLPSWPKKGCKGRKGNKHGHKHGNKHGDKHSDKHSDKHGDKHSNPVVEGLQGIDMPPPHQDRPHHKHHGHHDHHRHSHHRGIFQRIMGQVLLPIFVGIVAGMTVSLIGLVIGHGFVMLYRRFKGTTCERRCGSGSRRGFFGRHRRERRERERLAANEGDGEVEKGLLEGQEPAQAVESPPAYLDDAVEIVEKE